MGLDSRGWRLGVVCFDILGETFAVIVRPETDRNRNVHADCRHLDGEVADATPCQTKRILRAKVTDRKERPMSHDV